MTDCLQVLYGGSAPTSVPPEVVWRHGAAHVRLGKRLVRVTDSAFWEHVMRADECRRRELCSIAVSVEPATAYLNDVEWREDVGALDVM